MGGFIGTTDFGGGPLVSAGSWDGFIASYTVSGAYRWSRRFGGVGLDVIAAVAPVPDGNIVLGGVFEGTVSLTGVPLNSRGLADIFLLGLSSDSAPQWSTSIGSTQHDSVRDLAIAPDGRVFLLGRLGAAATVAGAIVAPSVDGSALVVATDRVGIPLWARLFSGDSFGTAVDVDGVGNIYVSGSFRGALTIDGAPPLLSLDGSFDGFVSSFDQAGTIRWSQRVSGIGNESVDLVVDSSGNIFIAGHFARRILIGTRELIGHWSGVGSDVYVGSLTAAGVARWAYAVNGDGDESLNSIALDVEGNVHAVGSYSSRSISYYNPDTSIPSTLSNAGGGDILALSYSASGALRWARGFGGVGDDSGHIIAMARPNGLWVTGLFSGGSINFGASPISGSVGATSPFLTRLIP